MSSDGLATLVRRWDELLLQQDDVGGRWPVSATGTVLRRGAVEEQIVALEERLGTALPPSYRGFLALSDGAWAQAGWGVTALHEPSDDPEDERALGFLDSSRVGWFREREPEYVEIWGYTDYNGDEEAFHYAFRRLDPECEYLDHDREQDTARAKTGHVRYALQVSSDVDGYTILLNPLVVDQRGEWEAWDFGSKLPGALRYRSFGALLAADVARLEAEAVAPPMFDVESLVPVALDEGRPVDERVTAAREAVWGGERERVLPVLALALADRSIGVDTRQKAAEALGRIDDPRAVAALVAVADDPTPRIQAVVLPPLAARDEPDARRAALAILTSPDVEDFVIRFVWPGSGETVWQAWRVTGDPRLLVQLAYCGDRRSSEPLVEALLDPSLPRETRDWLVRYAWWPRDPSVAPALVAAAELPDAPLVELGQALVHLGAEDEAVAVLARAVRESDPFGHAAAALGRLQRPTSRHELLDELSRRPTAAVVSALGSYAGSDVADALRTAAEDPELRLVGVDALETMPCGGGRDALADLAAGGDLLAARALARKRDERALGPLLDALAGEDADTAFEGADGLRDLRSQAAADALLSAVEQARDDDVVACAAHALVSMGAPQARRALDVLARSPSPCVRRLAEVWG